MQYDTTIIIKTFERPRNLERLLHSIFAYYPDIDIIVADDSKNARGNKEVTCSKWRNRRLTYMDLPYDIGLSAGRNAALDIVATEYFLLCDDDFVFNEKTDIMQLKQSLETENVDLVGGVLFETKLYKSALLNFIMRRWIALLFDIGFSVKLPIKKILCGHFQFNAQTLTIESCKDIEHELLISDMTFNFFLARTQIREHVRWRDELKLLEHLAFFYDFKQAGLSLLVSTTVGVNHLRDMGIRYRAQRYHAKNEQYHRLRMDMLNITEIRGGQPFILENR